MNSKVQILTPFRVLFVLNHSYAFEAAQREDQQKSESLKTNKQINYKLPKTASKSWNRRKQSLQATTKESPLQAITNHEIDMHLKLKLKYLCEWKFDEAHLRKNKNEAGKKANKTYTSVTLNEAYWSEILQANKNITQNER